ncbi:MAG: hypothetical protein WCP60_00875 [bacterium]
MILTTTLFCVSIGIAGLACCAFLAGQYNQIVRLRRQIVTEALQLDFALRINLHNLEKSCGNNPLTEVGSELARIESLSHLGAVDPISNDGIALLLAAKNQLDQLNHSLINPSCEEVEKRAEASLFLVREYNNRLNNTAIKYVSMHFKFNHINISRKL